MLLPVGLMMHIMVMMLLIKLVMMRVLRRELMMLGMGAVLSVRRDGRGSRITVGGTCLAIAVLLLLLLRDGDQHVAGRRGRHARMMMHPRVNPLLLLMFSAGMYDRGKRTRLL